MTTDDLMKDFEGTEAEGLSELRDAENTGEGVQLSFPAFNVWVINGESKQKNQVKTAPALYFGGWSGDKQKLDAYIAAGGAVGLLAGWAEYVGSGDSGEWEAVSGRVISVAFITRRLRWLHPQDKMKSGARFDKDRGLTRSHAQYLALAFNGNKPWGYVVLTAKGHQTSKVDAAIKVWDALIEPHKKPLNAEALGRSAFRYTIGTTGDAQKSETVGGGATSKITPMTAVAPEKLLIEQVKELYIGRDNVLANIDHLRAAQPWLSAWSAAAYAERSASMGAARPAADDNEDIEF